MKLYPIFVLVVQKNLWYQSCARLFSPYKVLLEEIQRKTDFFAWCDHVSSRGLFSALIHGDSYFVVLRAITYIFVRKSLLKIFSIKSLRLLGYQDNFLVFYSKEPKKEII